MQLRMAMCWLVAIATVVVLERIREGVWSPELVIGLVVGTLSGGDHGFVFPNHATGEPLHLVAVTAQFRRQAMRAGLPRCRVHDLRGMAGTLLLAGGADLKTVQETLGHHSIQLTGDVYVRAVSQARRDVADKMQHALGGTGQ